MNTVTLISWHYHARREDHYDSLDEALSAAFWMHDTGEAYAECIKLKETDEVLLEGDAMSALAVALNDYEIPRPISNDRP